ncbi:BnaC06g30430D [Brassica napus]|uniref:Ninja-family protein n=1 Tax=Brassica napus TaxID=3708 RepID=A0A078HQL5_BRANA|nr:unnamed protein product [Brassica napus]CDY40905.1 BnaC06g30430D [Brassica napus]
MSEANERSREMSRSMFPRDLLQRYTPISAKVVNGKEVDEEIELDLSLSLGGRFGVDKSKLARSSSVVGPTMPFPRENHQPETEMRPVETSVAGHMGLPRTTSLLVETEEEWRKRKEMESLRRMEARRRRSEKLRGRGSGGGNIIKPTEANNDSVPGEGSTTTRRRGRPRSVLPRWSGTANEGGLLRQHSSSRLKLELQPNECINLKIITHTKLVSFCCWKLSLIFDINSSSEEARSLPSPQQQHQQGAMAMPNNGLRRLSSVDMRIEPPPQGNGKKEMPCVFTRGDGPNGKRVDGILYRYGNGEEVKIMCVCHGDILSPADFVKHAGGPHVDHPLRHIIVNTSSLSNLF